MTKPTLYVFAGLPGSGKTTLAQELAKVTGATYLRIDTVEQSLRDLCNIAVEGEGYRLSYRIAIDNLRLGNSVIADSCNSIKLTRQEWNDTATHGGARLINIEVVCTDQSEHQRRIATRQPTIEGLKLPSWHQVENREYHHAWHCERLRIDTSGKSIAACVSELMTGLNIGQHRNED